SAPLRPQERDRIVARAAGNPLFIDELLRVGRTAGFDSLPETLDAVATREIDALRPPERRLVRYASVLGCVFDPALLFTTLEADDALLSLHFFRAQDWEGAWKSARVAGLRAAEAYAPAEVVTHLERAIHAARHLEHISPDDVADLLGQLAGAFTTLGLYDKAD